MNGPENKYTAPYTEVQVRNWLSWLARGMVAQEQSVFQIEQLQPTWLATREQQRWYVWLSMSASGFVVGFFLGFLLGLYAGGTGGLMVALVTGIFFGILLGACIGVTHLCWFELSRRHRILEGGSFLKRLMAFNVLSVLVFASVYLLMAGLFMVLLPEAIDSFSAEQQTGQFFFFGSTLAAGGVMGVLYGLVFGRRAVRERRYGLIETAERLGWSWSAAVAGIPRGLLPGALLGLWFGALTSWLMLSGAGEELSTGLKWMTGAIITVGVGIVGLICGGLTSAIFGGLVKKISEMKTRPNQGVRMTFRNAFVGGGFIFLFSWLTVALVFILFNSFDQGFGAREENAFLSTVLGSSIIGLYIGIIFGLLGLMWYGGTDLIRHYTLRWLLYRAGHTPWRYARFLDYTANELHFLQKVGGGYIFLHRFLLEHFADRDR